MSTVTPPRKYMKRPKKTGRIETGRFGWCVVLHVFGNGEKLRVRDDGGDIHIITRAKEGWWVGNG